MAPDYCGVQHGPGGGRLRLCAEQGFDGGLRRCVPESGATDTIRIFTFLGLAFIEFLALLTFVVIMLLLFR